MALALYRKYRPATFGEVVGQSHVTQPLRTALAAQRINHAYLFSGPRGCGKTSSARILARSLNCAQGPTDEPCGECDSCVALAPDGSGSVDVVEMDAASHGGVDDARELRDRAVFAPAQSRYRIFVIDEAHMVTQQGFNALLKIVEEPPDHLVFVFATTEPDKVLTTIRSRTHHYPFRLIPPGELRELLERICAEEGVSVDPAVYPLAISAGGGSARDALSVLDQLVAGAGAEGITYERAVALLGVTDVALIDAMVDALAANDPATVYGTVDRVVEAGHDPRRFASDLLDRLRDLVLLQSVPDAAERGLIQNAGDGIGRMREQAEKLGTATLTRFAEIVHAGLSEMRGATAPRLLLELLCARMMLPAASGDEAAVLQRIERVERRMTVAPPTSGGGAEAAPAPAPAARSAAPSEPDGGSPPPVAESDRAEPPPARAAEAGRDGAADAGKPPERPAGGDRAATPPEGHAQREQRASSPEPVEDDSRTGGGRPAAELRQVWNDLLRAVAERNRPTQALLLNASLVELRDNTLVLSMPTAGLRKQFMQARRIDYVREAMRAVVGGDWELECLVEGEERSARAPAATPQPERGGTARGAAEAPRSTAERAPATEAAPAPERSAAPSAQPAASSAAAERTPEPESPPEEPEVTPAAAASTAATPAVSDSPGTSESSVAPEPPAAAESSVTAESPAAAEPPTAAESPAVSARPEAPASSEPPEPPLPPEPPPESDPEPPEWEDVEPGRPPEPDSAAPYRSEPPRAESAATSGNRAGSAHSETSRPGSAGSGAAESPAGKYAAPAGSAAASTAEAAPRDGSVERDPDDEAVELLVSELGARRLD
ncbi:DNA polymerase III subunit gamma and tau [Actinopolyspora lacussalsi]|uniref:DNA polymerase III subunit gamma and tau n=1 Tax=Actinopolyspora righensis TaxID=995060 RepID=UPI000B86BAF7|nr:DNA polymerase III subunit gamma and tau [Actinopolyspora righensis]